MKIKRVSYSAVTFFSVSIIAAVFLLGSVQTALAAVSTKPTTPTNLHTTAILTTEIDLAWSASTDSSGIAGYRVERCTGVGCTSFAQIATPTGTSYSNTGLTSGTNYRYRVRAVSNRGKLSNYSTVLSVLTLSAPPPPPAPSVTVVSSSVSKNPLIAGDVQNMSVTLGSATTLSNLIVDIRVYDASNMMIARNGSNVNIAAGGTATIQYDYPSPSALPPGTYTMVVGVWSGDWSITYLYTTAQTFSVVSGTPPPPPPPPPPPAPTTTLATATATAGDFTVTGTVAKSVMTAGDIQYATLSVKSAIATTGLIVSLRYFDLNGATMMERFMSSGDFSAGETKVITMEYALRVDAPAGTYSIGVGIWGSNYTPTYVYLRNLPSYEVLSSGYVPAPPVTSLPPSTISMVSGVDQFVYNGPYFVQNNMWGITGLPAGSYSQSAGIGPVTGSTSVSARWQWSYPDGPNEVKGYPAIGIGQKPGQAPTPGSNMPKLIDSIVSAVSSWDVAAMYTGRGQLTYDLWLTRDANRYSCFLCTPITHEIMLAPDNFGEYAISNPDWYFGSTAIDGVVYRVWKADNFGGGATWRFVVLTPVNPIHTTRGSVDFKHIFDYLKSAGLITGQEYLSSIEFGNEMQYGTGDVLVNDFKAEVQ